MTRSVYIVGGAGSGKSTFTAELMKGVTSGPLGDLHSLRNAKALVTLRGHYLLRGSSIGLYLGRIRDSFPGTDGLDRASSPVGEAWLQSGGAEVYDFIIGEGATLATSRFIGALDDYTSMLLVHLHVDPVVQQARFDQRGSSQNPGFVLNTVTRSRNLFNAMTKSGAQTMSVDTNDELAWSLAQDLVADHLG